MENVLLHVLHICKLHILIVKFVFPTKIILKLMVANNVLIPKFMKLIQQANAQLNSVN